MKIEINGFSIELMTDDVNLTLKVSDSSGKELSNNTFSQNAEVSPVQTEIPAAEETKEGTEPTEEELKEFYKSVPTFEEFKKRFVK